MVHRVRATAWCVLLLLLVQGCAAEHAVLVRPSLRSGKHAVPLQPQGGLLLVQTVGERPGRLWYANGFHSWVLERDPSAMVLQALEEELKLMGIGVTEDPSQDVPRLEIELRWFGPYGHSPLTAAVIIALALYPIQSHQPIWRGKLQAGEQSAQQMVHAGDEAALMGAIISTALSDALAQLRWKPGFLEAVSAVLSSPEQFKEDNGAE